MYTKTQKIIGIYFILFFINKVWKGLVTNHIHTWKGKKIRILSLILLFDSPKLCDRNLFALNEDYYRALHYIIHYCM